MCFLFYTSTKQEITAAAVIIRKSKFATQFFFIWTNKFLNNIVEHIKDICSISVSGAKQNKTAMPNMNNLTKEVLHAIVFWLTPPISFTDVSKSIIISNRTSKRNTSSGTVNCKELSGNWGMMLFTAVAMG